MKNLLSKSLLCGVLASTFLIVNCQKAPNRAVTAKVTPPAKPTAVKSAACSEDAIKEAKSAKEINDALKVDLDKVKDKKTEELTETEKTDLTKLVNNLFDQSNKLIAEIQKITIGDKKEAAEACSVGEKSHDIKVIQSVVAGLGKTVKDKTGLDNKAAPKVDAASNKLELNDEIVITEELAKLLADETQLNGKSLIVAGKILTAEAEVKAAQSDKVVTSCAVTATAKDAKEALVADAKVLVANIDVKDNADKSKSIDVALGVKASAEAVPSLLSLTCKLAEGKDANVELRSALGALVKNVVKATKEEPKKEKPKTEEPKKEEPKTEEPKTDATAKANEALDILNAAASRK